MYIRFIPDNDNLKRISVYEFKTEHRPRNYESDYGVHIDVRGMFSIPEQEEQKGEKVIHDGHDNN